MISFAIGFVCGIVAAVFIAIALNGIHENERS